MAGSIPRSLSSGFEDAGVQHYNNPMLHRHNWLSGHLFMRLHANGVCEVFAHHINSRFFDDGLDLEDVVPVIGIRLDDGMAVPSELASSPWDGSTTTFRIGPAAFAVSEAARLATAERPGRMDEEDGFIAWQPYAAAELFGGVCPAEKTGDAWIFHPEEKVFPRGMARTVHFSFSLSDRSPRVARYLAPYWWYGACAELYPHSLLPVSNEYDRALDECGEWIRTKSVEGGFEDGSVPRGASPNQPPPKHGRHEPGWEGEIPYGQFLLSYRTARADDYHCAMRSAYHFTDVAVDHAAKLVRMHGYPPVAFAQPMNRVLGTVAAFLETGDPYLLDTAEAVIESAHRLHNNSWPRQTVGRDACFVRGAVMLYRFFASDHFRRIAHEGALAVATSQRANGSFGDQAGGSGIHQWATYITKPWMGLLATAGVLDYIELLPGDPALSGCILKFADWLMQARWTRNGATGWSYQHDFRGQPRYYTHHLKQWSPLPSDGFWHQESLGRVLGFASLRTGDPAYLDAWAESRTTVKHHATDHPVSAALQFLPWIQAHLWRTRLNGSDIHVAPIHFGPRTPSEARLHTPAGEQPVSWAPDGALRLPDGVRATEGWRAPGLLQPEEGTEP